MAPFFSPNIALTGLKEKADSILIQGDRLYVGTTTGNLHIYSVDASLNSGDEIGKLIETKKALSRRSIEKIAFVKDVNSLAILSDSQVTLYPLPNFSPPTPLVKAKAAFSFSVYLSVQHLYPDGKTQETTDGDFGRLPSIPSAVTQLIVGCRRKLVQYSWKDGEPEEPKEWPLPHSPRTMAFLKHDKLCLAYTATDYAIMSLDTASLVDVTTPVATSTSTGGMGSLGGLTGYMTLGLGAKPKPVTIQIGDGQVLIAKDNEGFVIGIEGRAKRTETLSWHAPPEDVAFVKPYIFSIMPPGTVPVDHSRNSAPTATTAPSFIPSAVVQISSALSLLPTQTVAFPSSQESSPSAHGNNCTIRLLTPSPGAKSPIFLLTTPTDRTAAATEGSTVWQIKMKTWGEQLDELVLSGSYPEALALLDTLDQALLPDKDQRRVLICGLNAVSQFRSGKFDDAVNTFLDLDLNPAKVVALYPGAIAGRLSVPSDRWIPLFGGPQRAEKERDASQSSATDTSVEDKIDEAQVADAAGGPVEKAARRTDSPAGSIQNRLRAGLGVGGPSGSAEDDNASISSKRKTDYRDDNLHRSVETLLRYLTDRRPKVAGALAAVNITPAQSHAIPFLSETSTEDLFALPNAPLSSLTPEQLLRFAQIVDTALFKSYLLTRPSLLGPLCRVANWCEVSEVEEELRAREKFAELIFLYNGKKMHAQALALLRQLSDRETDPESKLRPTISYLQKLGSEHLIQIFESAKWVFGQDEDLAFEIFTSEDVELPHWPVADFLERINPHLCCRYIEFLISERDEETATFHNRLAELYLNMTVSARKGGEEVLRKQYYAKLLSFIDTTVHYEVDRLYGLVPDDLYEARAILLGRLGRHDLALELYVYKLHDYLKAEEHCKRVYEPNTNASKVFLTLLRIYLRPTVQLPTDLLGPALDLISRHSPRLDAIETMKLLPPLVTAADVKAFLMEALRAPIFDGHVIREISRARNDQLARRLLALETRRVKITDSRICPHCHKRIGNSVIAVHTPHGEVTHYQCREGFSKRLRETRR